MCVWCVICVIVCVFVCVSVFEGAFRYIFTYLWLYGKATPEYKSYEGHQCAHKQYEILNGLNISTNNENQLEVLSRFVWQRYCSSWFIVVLIVIATYRLLAKQHVIY